MTLFILFLLGLATVVGGIVVMARYEYIGAAVMLLGAVMWYIIFASVT